MLSFSILFYPIPCILPSVYPNPCHVHVYMYIYSILYVYVYVYTHPSNAARGPMHHVLFMCFEPKACCFTVQQNPVTLRDSHPLVDDSSGVNWTTKLNWITVWQKSSKIIKKKSTVFFPNPSLHLFVFASEWPLESNYPSMSRTMFRQHLQPRFDDMAVSRFSMFGRNTMVTNSQIDVHFAVSDTIFAISFCWRHHPNGEVTQFLGSFWIPTGKLLHNYGKSPCSMGKSTINGDVQ